MVRAARTGALCQTSRADRERDEGTEMRKKTTLPSRDHGSDSKIQKGLIVKGIALPQSAMEDYALDNRSHRTTHDLTDAHACQRSEASR